MSIAGKKKCKCCPLAFRVIRPYRHPDDNVNGDPLTRGPHVAYYFQEWDDVAQEWKAEVYADQYVFASALDLYDAVSFREVIADATSAGADPAIAAGDRVVRIYGVGIGESTGNPNTTLWWVNYLPDKGTSYGKSGTVGEARRTTFDNTDPDHADRLTDCIWRNDRLYAAGWVNRDPDPADGVIYRIADNFDAGLNLMAGAPDWRRRRIETMPRRIKVDSSGHAYVLWDDGIIEKLDGATGSVLTSVQMGYDQFGGGSQARDMDIDGADRIFVCGFGNTLWPGSGGVKANAWQLDTSLAIQWHALAASSGEDLDIAVVRRSTGTCYGLRGQTLWEFDSSGTFVQGGSISGEAQGTLVDAVVRDVNGAMVLSHSQFGYPGPPTLKAINPSSRTAYYQPDNAHDTDWPAFGTGRGQADEWV